MHPPLSWCRSKLFGLSLARELEHRQKSEMRALYEALLVVVLNMED